MDCSAVRGAAKVFGAVLLLGLGEQSTAGPVQFVDATAAAGIGPYLAAPGMGCGIAAGDYDNDGDIDLFVATAQGQPNQLYRNNGDGTFSEIAASVGLAGLLNTRMALWFDFDGDHDLDLVVAACRIGSIPAPPRTLTLYRNDGGAFVDVSAGAGLGGLLDVDHLGGICAGDVDNDNLVDLLLTFWRGPTYLFKNHGDGTFTDIATSAGIDAPNTSWQPIMCDFDGDGFLDIFNAIDLEPNRLWMNQGDGTFVDVAAAAGVANAWNDMGVAIGDPDNDGDFDLYVTNIDWLGQGTGIEHNIFLRNDSVGATISFTEQSLANGTAHGYWGWGTTFFDANNDGWEDLAATNGYYPPSGFGADPTRYFHNSGASPLSFVEASTAAGLDDTSWGSGLIAFDMDRDGDQDLAQVCQAGPLRLRANVSPGAQSNNWLVVQPRMRGTNHFAIGATVRVVANGLTMRRLVTAGVSFMAQEPAEAHFGLGQAAIVQQVVVEWPGGMGQTVLNDVDVNQVVIVERPCPTDFDGDNQTGLGDLSLVLFHFGELVTPGAPGDVNSDGVVDISDVSALLFAFGAGCP